MRINGEWQLFEDGITRPTVRVQVQNGNGSLISEDFLIDSGADRTVFSAGLLTQLQLSTRSPEPGLGLSGVGGSSEFVLVTTVLEFLRDDGGSACVRGEFAAFTDLTATDLSVLGRDVLDNFDLIISRQHNEILLLAPRHRYRVEFNCLGHGYEIPKGLPNLNLLEKNPLT